MYNFLQTSLKLATQVAQFLNRPTSYIITSTPDGAHSHAPQIQIFEQNNKTQECLSPRVDRLLGLPSTTFETVVAAWPSTTFETVVAAWSIHSGFWSLALLRRMAKLLDMCQMNATQRTQDMV